MTKTTLRPEKYYSVSELSKVLGLAPYDMLTLINNSGILYELKDGHAAYKGSDIQPLIESKRCITQDTFLFTGMS